MIGVVGSIECSHDTTGSMYEGIEQMDAEVTEETEICKSTRATVAGEISVLGIFQFSLMLS
jgi:hypothetical protein